MATLAVRHHAFTSVGCLYAAILSVTLHQFRGRHINIAAPSMAFRDALPAA